MLNLFRPTPTIYDDVNKVFNYAAKEKHDEHFLNFLNEEDDFKTVAYFRGSLRHQ